MATFPHREPDSDKEVEISDDSLLKSGSLVSQRSGESKMVAHLNKPTQRSADDLNFCRRQCYLTTLMSKKKSSSLYNFPPNGGKFSRFSSGMLSRNA